MKPDQITEKRVLIAGMQRSGTTVIQRHLGAMCRIQIHPREIASGFLARMDEAFFSTPNEPSLNSNQYERLLETLLYMIKRTEMKELVDVKGFKTAIGRVEHAIQIVENFRRHFGHWKVIYIVRNDVLSVCASHLRAQSSGVWHKENKQNIEIKKIYIKVDDYISFVYRWHQINSVLATMQDTHDCLIVDYEKDILSGNIFRTEKLPRFLGIENPEVLPPPLEKISPPVDEFVENAEQLKALTPRILEDINTGLSEKDSRSKNFRMKNATIPEWQVKIREQDLRAFHPKHLRRLLSPMRSK